MIRRLIYLAVISALIVGFTNKEDNKFAFTNNDFIATCKECGYKLAEGCKYLADNYKIVRNTEYENDDGAN